MPPDDGAISGTGVESGWVIENSDGGDTVRRRSFRPNSDSRFAPHRFSGDLTRIGSADRRSSGVQSPLMSVGQNWEFGSFLSLFNLLREWSGLFLI